MLQGLRTVVYNTSDLAAAKAWYSKAFTIKPYFDEPFYVGFNVGGFELGLMPDGNDNNDKTASPVAYWGVADARASYTELLKHGATAHEEPQNVGGDIVAAAVKDPFGNVIGLMEWRDFPHPATL
jgi:predicted enzyme related to lactoylglutathione lyase